MTETFFPRITCVRFLQARPLIVSLLLSLVPLFSTFGEVIGTRVQLGNYGLPKHAHDYTPEFQSAPYSRAYTGGAIAATAGPGTLSITGNFTSPANVGGTAYLKLNSYFADTVTIDAPGRTGQEGTFTVKYTFEGTYDANGWWDNSVGISINFGTDAGDGTIPNMDTVGGECQPGSNNFSYRANDTYSFAACATLFPGVEQSETRGFTFGQPFDFWLKLGARIKTYVDVPGDTQVAMSLVKWSGFRNITAGGTLVDNAIVSSASTINWTQAVPAPSNNAPVAVGQSVVLDENTARPITLGGNDVENSPLAFSIITQPGKGVLSGTPPNLTYTPNAQASGIDSFTFKVNDGTVDSAPATVSIRIDAAVGAPIVFDAVADFSSSNPSGAWTFGYSQTRGTEFQTMTRFISNSGNGLDIWGIGENGPWILKNQTGALLSYATISHPPDLLNLDPSFDGRNAVLRWTASAAGQYRVSGLFQGLDSTSTDVAVIANGTSAVVGAVNGRGNQAVFDFVVDLSSGQTVDFSVGQGSGGSLYDGTGLKAAIRRLGAPPDACAAVPSGLISWWRGEDNLFDSINANHIASSGLMALVPGRVGKAFSLDGLEASPEVPDSTLVRPAFVTVEAWVRLSSLDNIGLTGFKPGLQYILFKKNTRRINFEGFALLKHRVGGVDQFAFEVTSAAGVAAIATSKSEVKAKEWYHLVGTYNGSTAKLYVNGVQESSQPANFPLDYGNRPLFIGRSGEPYHDGWFTGEIDEISLYNRALTGGEIATLFNAAGHGKCPPLTSGGREVSGLVVDAAQVPVAGVEVAAFRNLREFVALGFDAALARALTDASGRYSITGLPPDMAVTLVARYDANNDGQDLDHRFFAPAHQLAFGPGSAATVPPFVLQAAVDNEPPALTVSNPPSAPANELTQLPLAGGTTADSAGIFGVWAALSRIEASTPTFYNWDNRQFETTAIDAPRYYSSTAVRSTVAGHDWELLLPRLAEGSYQLRVLSVDNARRTQRVNADFRIVPVTHIFTTAGEQSLPPLPPGVTWNLQSTGGDLKISLPGDPPASRLNIGAAVGSSLTAVLPQGAKAFADGINALKGTTLALPGAVVGTIKNVGGTLGHALAPISQAAATFDQMFGASFKGFFSGSTLSPAPVENSIALQSSRFTPAAVAQPITGSITIEGDYDQAPEGKLVIAIAGITYSELGPKDYDRLTVTGAATLSGTLAFTFLDANDALNNSNPFVPPAGSQFDVLIAGRIEAANLVVLGPLAGDRKFEWAIVDLLDGTQALRLISTASIAVRLSILETADSIEISYPSEASGYTIETTTDLGSSWTAFPSSTTRVTITPDGTARFFRLRKP